MTGDFTRRFERQTRFAPLGDAGQARLGEARVLVVGCGALGGALCQSLWRSGVGTLVVVDRDVVDESNLPRQVLFEDHHAREGTPKVEAARETLARIGGPTVMEAHATHLDAENLEDLAEECVLILDGTDNLQTRYLLNDYAVSEDVPWIYAGVVGSGGLVLPVLPKKGPCLRCVFPEPPPPGTLPTCDTAGVLQPAVALVAAMQAGLALRLLAEGRDALQPALCELDAWSGEVRRIACARTPGCPCCDEEDFAFLDAPTRKSAVVFCGRNAVQVIGRRQAPDLDAIARGLDGIAKGVQRSGSFLRFVVDEERLTVFPDGRALIEGTDDADRARALYDRYVGS